METPINTTLNDTTSYLSVYTSTGSFFYKNIQLPLIYPSTIGRIIYFKEASEYPGVPIYTISSLAGGSLIESSTILGVANHTALTLQATQSSTTSYWSILNGYRGNAVFSTQQLPIQSVPVYVSSVSQVFVDLRTQSKTVVLPRIQTLANISSSALYMTIKDAYGWAGTSTLYVSTSYPDRLEMSTINNSIKLTSNFASIDLVANSILSKWNILNFYSGNLVDRS
jgi:hypothetical protein